MPVNKRSSDYLSMWRKCRATGLQALIPRVCFLCFALVLASCAAPPIASMKTGQLPTTCMSAAVYPPESVSAREAGTAIVAIHLSSEGKILAAEVKQSTGYPRLDVASIAAATSPDCKYSPAIVNGVPTEAWGDFKFTWALPESSLRSAPKTETASSFGTGGQKKVQFWRQDLPGGAGQTLYVKNLTRRSIIIDSFEINECVNVINTCGTSLASLGLTPGQTGEVVTLRAKDTSKPIDYRYNYDGRYATVEITGPTRTREEVQLGFQLAYHRVTPIIADYFKQFPDVLQSKIVVDLVISPDGAIKDCILISSDVASSEYNEKILAHIKQVNVGTRDVPEYRYDNYAITLRR